ncbi:MAG: electron transport complex subunit RsxC [Saprospiraceae bacterium]|nr:electron transport complex subunit RsxC [Saprospiraceae bacterium]
MSNQMTYGEGTLTFRHGVHPEEYKELSNHKKIQRIPFVEEYVLPLGQHIGAPSKALVRKGEEVRRGQKIAASVGFVSVALHSPVDGTVTDVGLVDNPKGEMVPGVRIKTDPYSSQQLEERPVDFESLDIKGFITAIQQAGIVGLGGAAFPSHVKFALPEDKSCRYIMLNGCECEPFLTADHRTMLEHAREVIDGILIIQHFLKAQKAFIAVEANKPDAIEALRLHASNNAFPVEVVPLQVKYPQGAEKMMITAILGQEVPTGKLPIDLGVLVVNVGTSKAISDYFRKGIPLFERILTVTGTAINNPANLLVPIGTPMREVINACGGVTDDAARILLGGPMMGAVQKSLDVPVVKGTSGLLVLGNAEIQDFQEYSCIRCGRCLQACPLFLNPARMGLLAKKGLWDDMEDLHVMDCFECGSCSFVCPSGIPLVQSFRVAKGILREKSLRERSLRESKAEGKES